MHRESRDGWSRIGWNWTPTRLNSCGLDPDSSWRRSTQRPWQSVNTPSNPRLPPSISAWHSTVNWEWTSMSTTSLEAVSISWDSWDPSDDHSPRMPRKHWSIPSYQVVSTIATAFFTVPQTLSCKDCNPSSTRQPGWSRTGGSSTISLMCWGISSIGFPSVSVSTSRSRSSSTTPSMVEVRHTSAAPAILSGRSAPGLTCDLLFEATWLYHEPGLVASSPEASMSPDRLFGTHCPRTFDLRNCHWNVSNLRWKHIYFTKHMPSSAHSAFVTWLRGT